MSIRSRMVERLGPESWVEAAVLALTHGGIEAVRVETLAKSLGVTKGSFYWHFSDRRGLLDATLEWWEKIATSDVIAQVEERGGDRLKTLIEICTSGQADRLEGAIRGWAGADAAAQVVVQRVDTRRERYVVDLLLERGHPKDTAVRRSRILYLALIGEFTWTSHGGRASSRATWQELYDLIVQ